MRVLSLTHNDSDPSGTFGETVRERGHVLEERSLAFGRPPADAVERYDAVLVFGGTMHTHEEIDHPWLKSEKQLLARALERSVPVFGVCLGGQLLANAAGARVHGLELPEIGWYDVELTPAARDDPVFGRLPNPLESYQWHSYRFDLPPGAVELARDSACVQGFRLDGSWGVQFHPEVDLPMLDDWITHYDTDPGAQQLGLDAESGKVDARKRVDAWMNVGRELCGRFLEFVESRGG